ncbi:NAD-dependent epimerase/dehydratase family protein [Streptomyces kaempferi]
MTGSAGFIGSHLAHAPVQASTTVIGMDRKLGASRFPSVAIRSCNFSLRLGGTQMPVSTPRFSQPAERGTATTEYG